MNLQLCQCPLLAVGGGDGRGCDGTNVRSLCKNLDSKHFVRKWTKRRNWCKSIKINFLL